MSITKYKVILYMAFGPVYASIDDVYGGDIRYFNTEQEAENYARSKEVVYEVVKVTKEEREWKS